MLPGWECVTNWPLTNGEAHLPASLACGRAGCCRLGLQIAWIPGAGRPCTLASFRSVQVTSDNTQCHSLSVEGSVVDGVKTARVVTVDKALEASKTTQPLGPGLANSPHGIETTHLRSLNQATRLEIGSTRSPTSTQFVASAKVQSIEFHRSCQGASRNEARLTVLG